MMMNRQSATCMCRAGLPEWCGAFKACDTKNIAVVGNGPLSAQQRSELKSGRFQVIVRFNYLNNRYKSTAWMSSVMLVRTDVAFSSSALST